jgi:hypothetical protein
MINDKKYNLINVKAFIIFLSYSLICCKESKKQGIESPLISIVKLESAISYGDKETARLYIDVDRVYGEIAKKESKSSEQIWSEMMNSKSEPSKSKKIINSFPFHKYHYIEEIIDKNNATVSLIPSFDNRGVYYKLELQDNRWVVVLIKWK